VGNGSEWSCRRRAVLGMNYVASGCGTGSHAARGSGGGATSAKRRTVQCTLLDKSDSCGLRMAPTMASRSAP
jgi:hypothetical protein